MASLLPNITNRSAYRRITDFNSKEMQDLRNLDWVLITSKALAKLDSSLTQA